MRAHRQLLLQLLLLLVLSCLLLLHSSPLLLPLPQPLPKREPLWETPAPLNRKQEEQDITEDVYYDLQKDGVREREGTLENIYLDIDEKVQEKAKVKDGCLAHCLELLNQGKEPEQANKSVSLCGPKATARGGGQR